MSASVSPASTPTLLFAQWNHWLKKYPASKNFCSFLDDSGKSILSQKYTYRGLYDRVEALAVLLRSEHGLNAGDRVLLVFLPSTDFIVAFLACLRASIIAVPVYPPNPAKVKKDMYQFAAIQVWNVQRVLLEYRKSAVDGVLIDPPTLSIPPTY